MPVPRPGSPRSAKISSCRYCEIILRMMARWIRLGAIEPFDFRAAYSALAAAQLPLARPILLWGQGDGQYLFALIAPRRIAPGREARWVSWALAPAIATYRQFGLPAYLDGESICLHGQKLASATIASIGECAVIASAFLRRFPRSEERRVGKEGRSRGPGYT